jgi:hypothetical protein
MSIENRKIIVEELISLISKGNAHASFEDAVAGVNLNLITEVPDGLPYGLWQLVEHIRITQWDILEFCKGPDHQSPKWPDEYWPNTGGTVSKEKWTETLESIRKDREEFFELLREEARDLYEPFAHGDGQNLFREALLIADHNSYHLGEIVIVRRLLKDWKS